MKIISFAFPLTRTWTTIFFLVIGGEETSCWNCYFKGVLAYWSKHRHECAPKRYSFPYCTVKNEVGTFIIFMSVNSGIFHSKTKIQCSNFGKSRKRKSPFVRQNTSSRNNNCVPLWNRLKRWNYLPKKILMSEKNKQKNTHGEDLGGKKGKKPVTVHGSFNPRRRRSNHNDGDMPNLPN